MKHILKKFHFGGSSHDSARHGEIAPPTSAYSPSTPSPTSLSVSPSATTTAAAPPPLGAPSPVGAPPPPWPDHRQAPEAAPGPGSAAAVADGSGGAGAAMGGGGPRGLGGDYFTSEEDFQMQLALAISASNSEFRDDPHNDQIRAATLLSLGKHGDGPHGEDERTPEALSKRYWDYNVLDYDERVLDGFYDVFALSAKATGHGKMPSLTDLQTNIGDLGFEVIIVNRQIDNDLIEMEQVVQCFSIDCQSSGTAVLVQRIAELVMERMGGPVMDANDMLARWMEKSTTMRTSLQTSLLPIGGVTIGLSRHRALLFKVLADKVGIPCKLVKGSLSHYSGIDDDAVNIVRLENEREFLVDLMAAPGTLLPADVLNTKDTPVNSQLAKTSRSSSSWTDINTGSQSSNIDAFLGDGNIGKLPQERDRISEMNPWVDKTILLPSGSRNDSLPSSSRSSTSMEREISLPVEQSIQFLIPGHTAFDCEDLPSHAGVKENVDFTSVSPGLKENQDASSHSDGMNSKDLFAELNPFQAIAGKGPLQFRPVETKTNGYQRRRENTAPGTGRSPLPLVWKNRSAFNDGPNQRYKNSVEGPVPRKNMVTKDQNALQSPFASRTVSPGKTYQEISKIGSMQIPSSTSFVAGTNADQLTEPVRGSPGHGTDFISPINHEGSSAPADGCAQVETPFTDVRPSENKNLVSDGRNLLQYQNDQEKLHTIVDNKHDKRRPTHDRFLGKDSDSSSIPSLSKQDRLDPMFDDVAECEIRWEDLIIGERIGLGSYGEVYRADWNGTEVAVKKFLDQDFYGDALDEFRSEVRIMRRLRHPNVVLFMGAVTRPPNLSIVTEFLPRGSLYRILHRPNCQIDQKRRIKMALDVAKGMNCLHTSTPTIVHRDLKSPNLLVDKNWNVKVCDFGLSRLKHSTFLSSKSTAGTPEWMAPEVLRNEQSNEKCDVYSFGVILWELATLRMPWSGMNPMQVVGAVGFQNRRLEIPKELDPVVARTIWECWQTDPSLRPSFAELMSVLKPLQRLAISSEEDGQNTHLPQEIAVNSSP